MRPELIGNKVAIWNGVVISNRKHKYKLYLNPVNGIKWVYHVFESTHGSTVDCVQWTHSIKSSTHATILVASSDGDAYVAWQFHECKQLDI